MLPVKELLESKNGSMLDFALTGLSAFLLLLPAVIPGESRRALSFLDSAPLIFLGTISYGIYLFHLSILHWLRAQEFQLGTAALFTIVMVVTVVVACASYYLIERPVQRLGRSREAPRPAHIISTTGSVGR